MRQMTKLMAAMLVVTCAMVMVPQRAEASLWESLENLIESEPIPGRLYVGNYAGRKVRIRMWSNHGDYEKAVRQDQQLCGFSSHELTGTWFAVEAAVWNKYKQKYIVMDYIEGPAYQNYVFYKHARGDFRLRIWE